MSREPTASADRFRSNQSMLSMLAPWRFSEDGSGLALKSISMVTTGESEWDRSAKAGEAAGSWATWTRGGGRDRAVLTGRVVTLAVTGSGASGPVASCLMKGEISGKKRKEKEDEIQRAPEIRGGA